jgi:hypothetical protein
METDMDPKKPRSIAESDADLTRKIEALGDWDEISEVTEAIQKLAEKKHEPDSVPQLAWRAFMAIPTTPGKIITVVLAGVAAAYTHSLGWW